MCYLVIIQKFNNETPEAKSIFGYESVDSAKAALYSTMASSIANENVSTAICDILDNDGLIIKYEKWVRE